MCLENYWGYGGGKKGQRNILSGVIDLVFSYGIFIYFFFFVGDKSGVGQNVGNFIIVNIVILEQKQEYSLGLLWEFLL